MRRRHSVIGPLILILIGTLFLAHNLHPEWLSFRIIAMYWPFLLIAWGLIRLIEIFYWKFTSKPLPQRGISSGEWVLIIFVCLIGSGLFFFHERAPGLPRVFAVGRGMEIFGESYDFPIQEQTSTAKISKIVLETARGNTRIVGSDMQDVKIAGRRSIRSFSQSEAEEVNKKTGLRVTTEGDQLVIRAGSAQGMPSDSNISTDLELTVPRGTSVTATGRYGDFDVININGSVDINSNNAGVRLQDIAGNARVDLRRSDIVRAVNVKGNVDVLGRGDDVELENISGNVTINGYYSGDITCRNLAKPVLFQSGTTELRIERLPGQFDLSLGDFVGRNLVGPVRMTAQSKDIQIQDFEGEVTVSVERGDIKMASDRPPAAKVNATAHSGNIELALPAGAAFGVTATTHRGRIENDFSGETLSTSRGESVSSKHTTGNGPAITLTTDRGEIFLRKK